MKKVIFQPSGRRGSIEEGLNIIEASRALGVDIEALCGENKSCGKCKVRIEEGFFGKFGITSSMKHVSPWQEEEEKFISKELKDQGYRLGCCAKIQGDLLIYVPEESRAGKQAISKAARDIRIENDPAVKQYYVHTVRPTLEDPVGDFERICDELRRQYGLENLTVDLHALRDLPTILRQGQWGATVSVWMDREIIRIRPGREDNHFGMAFDIGTTTLAGYLCNLSTPEVINTQSIMNPQCKYGEDVMSRISYHMMNAEGLKKMSKDIVNALNKILQRAVAETHPSAVSSSLDDGPGSYEKQENGNRPYCLKVEDIEDVTIVCNTAMHHILLEVDPQYMALAPFAPVIHRGQDIKARDLGIHINPGAYIHLLPIEAGFVGADNVGVLIAEKPYDDDEIQLIVDIGTNGELVLGNREKLICSSCATGPALEGAQLTFGMRAAPGAIERIKMDPETHEVDFKVVGRDAWKSYSQPGEMQAKGICGSGVLDLLAELYRSGVVLKSGRFDPEEKSNRYRRNATTGQPEFVVAWAKETAIGKDIVISQQDIQQVQLAKAALYSGCKLMMRRMGIKRVNRVKIAGAFGTHVDREKALIIGLFPDCEIERISSVGNAAGDGARVALLNRKKREEADWIARNVEHIELTLEKDFQKEFMEAIPLPHMNDPFPHLGGIVPSHILNQK